MQQRKDLYVRLQLPSAPNSGLPGPWLRLAAIGAIDGKISKPVVRLEAKSHRKIGCRMPDCHMRN